MGCLNINNKDKGEPEITPSEIENEAESTPIPDPIINVEVSGDKMAVFLKIQVFHQSSVVTKSEVMGILQANGVVYGIDEAIIEDYCKYSKFYKQIKIASGKRPVAGDNGYVEYHFNTDFSKAPKELPGGIVDYKNFDVIQNVSKGDLLCTVTYATTGVDGISVLGKPVAAKSGKNPWIPNGKNLTISEDRTRIYAAVEGAIQFEQGRWLNVEQNHMVRGDVGPETGNIVFNGNVVVSGNVLEGFSIKAKKNISIRGYVEGADLEAGESISVSLGFNGMSKGSLKAEGDITVKFVENGEIWCGGVFRADVALNSDVKSKESIIIRGNKSTIVSGTYTASKLIYAKNIGSEDRNNTNLILKEFWYESQDKQSELKSGSKLDKEHIKLRIEELEKLLTYTVDKLNDINKPTMDPQAAAKRITIVKKLILQKSEVLTELESLTKQLEEIERHNNSIIKKLIVTGTIYPGAKVTLENTILKLEQEYENVKIFEDENGIDIGPILPNELDIK